MTKQNEDKEETYKKFKKLINMSPTEIEKWLTTKNSKEVGQDSGDGESIGHKSGKHILKIVSKKKEALNEDDYSHMHKVIAYISRHLAQRPKEVKDSNWEYSLKNWGHDPTIK